MRKAIVIFLGLMIAPYRSYGAPASEENMKTTCLNELRSGSLPIDFTLAKATLSTSFRVLMAPSFSSDESNACWNYTWIKVMDAFNKISVTPAWAGTPIGAETCSHSNIEYAVYAKTKISTTPGQSVMSINYAGGGLLWGKTINGTCQYSVANWPIISYGTNAVNKSTLGFTDSWFIAVRSWNHNHSVPYCGANQTCFWTTKVTIGG